LQLLRYLVPIQAEKYSASIPAAGFLELQAMSILFQWLCEQANP